MWRTVDLVRMSRPMTYHIYPSTGRTPHTRVFYSQRIAEAFCEYMNGLEER